MQTFEEVAARAAAQQHPQVVEVKQLLAPALVALRQLQRDYRDKKSEWLGRLATVQAKWQLAVSRRCSDRNIVMKLEELTGGHGLSSGLILGTEQMIAGYIQQIENFGPNELPHRNIWLSWPQAPTKIRDNFSGIERSLAYLEQQLKDGGPVYRWMEEQGPPPASLPIEPQRPAAAIKTETDFTL